MDSDPLENAVLRLLAEVERGHRPRVAVQENSPQAAREHWARRVAREPALRGVIDDACRQWIDSGAWPIMDQETTLFVWDRIFDAHLFLGWLQTYGFRCAKAENDLLELGLIHYWESIGVFRF